MGMRIAVEYQDERLDFEIGEDRLVGHWSGPELEPARPSGHGPRPVRCPERLSPPRSSGRPRRPRGRPARPVDAGSPGDPRDDRETLRTAEVERITVVSTAPEPAGLPEGVTWLSPRPRRPAQIAYLASTSEGRRVYLNRQLTDADLVVPIGTLGYDASLGYRGPWSSSSRG